VLAFLTEWLFSLLMLLAFGAVGGFALVPFRAALPFAGLAAPFAGLLLMAFGAALTYNVLELPITIGFVATALVGLGATVLSLICVSRGPASLQWRSWLFPAAVALVVVAIVARYTNYATILFGHPGLQYWQGTDHLGYAHLADWILAHPPSDRPRTDPAFPYESWPALLLHGDPRFGAFSTLALVSTVRGLPASFAYDSTCAVALSATTLGLAALFARGRLGLALLVVGLLTSQWFDYTRTGFFGKALGYPAALFVAGLFMMTATPLRLSVFLPLVLLVGGASVVYPAEASGLFIGLLSVTFLAARVLLGIPTWFRRPADLLREHWQHVVALALLGLLALAVRDHVAQSRDDINTLVAIRGMVTALVTPDVGTPIQVLPWEHVRLALADLDHSEFPITGLERGTLETMLAVALALWLVIAVIAAWRRDPVAIALTWGPILLAALYAAATSSVAQWSRSQLPGTFYPLALCGAARLLDDVPLRSPVALFGSGCRQRRLAEFLGIVVVAAVMLGAIWLHLPRVRGAIKHYAGPEMPARQHFSLAETDALVAAIGDRPVRVDIAHPHLAIFLLVELGRRGVDVQWTPATWRYTVDYRRWPAPTYDEPADLLIQSLADPPGRQVTTLVRNRQYRLTAPEDRGRRR
jgi:hypothetical protein